MAALIGPIALFFLDIGDDKEKFCTIVKVAVILAGILVYYLAEYRDIHILYIPYAVIVWGIWYYFKEEYGWDKWMERQIGHFPNATHKERVAVIRSVPGFDYAMTRKFMEMAIYAMEDLTKEELLAIGDCDCAIPEDRLKDWNQLKARFNAKLESLANKKRK